MKLVCQLAYLLALGHQNNLSALREGATVKLERWPLHGPQHPKLLQRHEQITTKFHVCCCAAAGAVAGAAPPPPPPPLLLLLLLLVLLPLLLHD